MRRVSTSSSCDVLRIDDDVDLSSWQRVVDKVEAATDPVTIGLIGKYIELPDAYLSVVEALKHAGFHHGAAVEIEWIQSESVEGLLADGILGHLDGVVIPGGFGYRGVEGKIAAARYARENALPCLGLCLGLHAMTIDFARNVCGLADANSTEFDPVSKHPVIDLMLEQRGIEDKGGTMRLGAHYAVLANESQVARAYGEPVVSERQPSPLRVQRPVPEHSSNRMGSGARGRHPTASSSSSSSCLATRSGSPRRPTPSSRAGRIAHIRCFANWSRHRSNIATPTPLRLPPTSTPDDGRIPSDQRVEGPSGPHLAPRDGRVRSTRRSPVRA